MNEKVKTPGKTDAAEQTITLDQIKALIATATDPLATIAQVNELINASQSALLDYVNAVGIADMTVLGPVISESAPPALDPAWLAGLLFHTATQEKRMVEGRPRLVATTIERELLPEDVLGYRVTDNQVFIVAADGTKHTVEI